MAAIFGWLYFTTSAPSITWAHESQDSGELAACAATLGIPHPTGYPLYTLIGWMLVSMFHPFDPGRVMVLLSCFCGAIAVGLIARASALAATATGTHTEISPRAAGWWGALAAAYAGANPLLWSQSVVCEVYALSTLLEAVVWLFLLTYLEAQKSGEVRPGRAAVVVIGLTFGLILAHHVIAAAVFLPVVIVFLARKLPRPLGDVGRFVLSIAPGLLFYAYLPLRSMAQPVLDWGNPETAVNFARHVTAWQYRGLMFGVSAQEFWRHFGMFRWTEYWGVGGVTLFLTGVAVMGFSPKGTPGRILAPALVAHALLTSVFASGYRVSDYEIFYYPMLVPVSIAIAAGLAWLAGRLRGIGRLLPALLALILGVTIAVSIRDNWRDMDVSNPLTCSAVLFAVRAMSELPENSLVVSYGDGTSFALMYAANCGVTDPTTGARLQPRPDLDIIVANWVKYDWFRENLQARAGRGNPIRFLSASHERDQALRTLIDQNFTQRPVLVTPEVRNIIVSKFSHYEMVPVGTFFFEVVGASRGPG